MNKKICLIPLICMCLLTSCNNNNNEGQKEPESAIFLRALDELGKPYEWGAVGPNTYDASGFVSYCVTGEHIRIGTTYTFLTYPVAENPTRGDICVNSGTCGIYAGGDQMIYAPGFGQVISYGSIQPDMIIVRY